MLKIFQVVHVSGTSRVSFRFTHKYSKRNFTRLKFIKNIRIIPGYFKAHDKFNQIQFLSQWLSEDKNKFQLKWIKKNESKVLCGFFCPWWKNEERYFSWTNGYHGYFYLLFEDKELKSWNKSFYESLLLKRDTLKSVIART